MFFLHKPQVIKSGTRHRIVLLRAAAERSGRCLPAKRKTLLALRQLQAIPTTAGAQAEVPAASRAANKPRDPPHPPPTATNPWLRAENFILLHVLSIWRLGDQRILLPSPGRRWLENWRYSGVKRGLRTFSPGSGGSQASCWCVQSPCLSFFIWVLIKCKVLFIALWSVQSGMHVQCVYFIPCRSRGRGQGDSEGKLLRHDQEVGPLWGTVGCRAHRLLCRQQVLKGGDKEGWPYQKGLLSLPLQPPPPSCHTSCSLLASHRPTSARRLSEIMKCNPPAVISGFFNITPLILACSHQWRGRLNAWGRMWWSER